MKPCWAAMWAAAAALLLLAAPARGTTQPILYSPGRTYYRSLYPDQTYYTDRYGATGRINTYAVHPGAATYVASCSTGTCGVNAHCTVIGDRAVCSCLRYHLGDPISSCTRAECLDESECRAHQTCRGGRCIGVCEGVCGANALCYAVNHVPVCQCPPGYTGNPATSCRPFEPAELCHPSPCGANTNCEVIKGVPTCKCSPGFRGDAFGGCTHECERDTECSSTQICRDFKCQSACSQCGKDADCENTGGAHSVVCKCPKGYLGNPYESCRPECYGDVDCPPGRPACFYGTCKNPCEGSCGVRANCELRGLTPVCSCPKDMTGDPFTYCRPFEKRDLCEPNPCGANARCDPGYDRTGADRPVCNCMPGYVGNPLTGCIPGECTEDAQCADSRACINYRCQNPCRGQCGVNAECTPKRHIAVCTCIGGHNGDALSQCRRIL